MDLYFKDGTSNVHVIEEGFEDLLGKNFPDRIFTSITKEEALAIMDGLKPPASELARAQITQMEREQMLPRGTREALLAITVALSELRGVTEATLYADNIAYRKIKDFDSQIAALRAQL